MKKIDLNTWSRREHFNFFRGISHPNFAICANLDITELYHTSKKNDYSLFKVMVFLVTKVANQIEEFRYRTDATREQVVVHEVVHTSFTYLGPSELFCFCTVDFIDDMRDFYKRTVHSLELQRGRVVLDCPGYNDNLIYITSIPWVSFTSVRHEIDTNKPDSVPRICWGKYVFENQKVLLPFSLTVSHCLMDGIHIGKYFHEIERLLDSPIFDISMM
ncbi:MAG: chloramphenicol acetyltransferase [Oligoflexia bacterium]|nr:chloramphenicol acetyltransferase [Oligoflexia bacterium]